MSFKSRIKTEMSFDLSSLLAAVKPRQHTPKFTILSGLYCLNAHVVPVTVESVNSLLRLQLGSKAPVHIAAHIRDYRTCAARVDAGPPAKWKLTVVGIQFLQKETKLDLILPSRAAYDFDVGIICALVHPEFRAVMDAMGGEGAWKEIGDQARAHLYHETSLKTSAGQSLRVVGTTSTSMGLTAAAIATTQLVLTYRPRLVCMVGIAAGTRTGSKEFGDILVADPSVDYNSGKVETENGIRKFLPDPYPIGLNPRLRSILQKYRGTHPCFAAIQAKWGSRKPARLNRLHLGPLGAADQVIDDETRIFEIQSNWRKLIGVEMETYAVYRACDEAPEPKPRFVSFKAVCDFAAQKTDSWQDYAAFSAAEFAAEFLTNNWEAMASKPAQ